MTASFTENLKQRYAGDLSEGEKAVYTGFRAYVHQALNGRIGFKTAVVALWSGLSVLRRFGYDVDRAMAAGEFDPSIECDEKKAMPNEDAGNAALSREERAFLEDADGLIDWATRNGVSFLLVLEILGHDLSELAREDFDLEKTLRNILPKVSGWANLNTQPVGEAAEQA